MVLGQLEQARIVNAVAPPGNPSFLMAQTLHDKNHEYSYAEAKQNQDAGSDTEDESAALPRNHCTAEW